MLYLKKNKLYVFLCLFFYLSCLFLGQNSEYFKKLKHLIESTFAANKNRRIFLISHSMGAPYSLYFLNHADDAWKEKYIDGWITISGM